MDGVRRSVQYQRGVRSGSSTANCFPVCSHYMELFLDRAGVCYLMRPCKPRGGGEGVNPPNLDRSRNRVGREKLIYVVGNTFITYVLKVRAIDLCCSKQSDNKVSIIGEL